MFRARGTGVFGLVWACALAQTASTLGGLPEPVATSFGAGGLAHGFLSRALYVGMTLGYGALVPPLLLAAFTWLPRRAPRLALPRGGAPLDPTQRERFFDQLGRAGVVVATSAAVFFALVHAFVREANARVPARLDDGPFLVVVGVFLAVVLGSVVRLIVASRALAGDAARRP